jgi:hypothetical protein
MTEEAEAPRGRLNRRKYMRMIHDFEVYANTRDSPTDRELCEHVLNGLKELARAVDSNTDDHNTLAQAASALAKQGAILGRCADAFASVTLEALAAGKRQHEESPIDINKIIRDSASLREAPTTAQTLVERLAKAAKAMGVDLHVHNLDDDSPKPKPSDEDDEDDEVAAAAPPPAAPAETSGLA